MNTRAIIRTALVVTIVIVTLIHSVVALALGLGVLTKPGVTFDLRSGIVTAVRPGSPGATAGVRVGDRADFERGGWQLHLSLGRTGLFAGRETALPLVRDGKAVVATLIGPPATAPPDAWADFLNVVSLLGYTGLGALLYALRRNAASLVFFALACAYSLRVDNLAPLLFVSPSWMPLGMILVSAVTVAPEMFGLLYFGLLFANDAAWTAAARRYVLIPAVLIAALYAYHFFGYTVWAQPFDSYLVYSVLTWLVFAVAAAAITARMNRDPNPARLRWVAVGLWTQALLNAAFLIDQNMQGPAGGTAIVGYLFAWFQPACCASPTSCCGRGSSMRAWSVRARSSTAR